MSYGDIKGHEKERMRKEVRRALAPELPVKLPARRSTGQGNYGIRYTYNGFGGGHVFTRWYEKRSGRDQAFRVMSRPRSLSGGRSYKLYKLLEKFDRVNHA